MAGVVWGEFWGLGGRQRSGEGLGLPSSPAPAASPTLPHPNPTQISQLLARALTFFNLQDLATPDMLGSLKILSVDCLNVSHYSLSLQCIAGSKRNAQFHVSCVLQNSKLPIVDALLECQRWRKRYSFLFRFLPDHPS